MIYDTSVTKEFFTIWKKYRPVILKLMIDSVKGSVQEYKLSKHEFTDVNTRKSSTFSFKLEIYKGRTLHSTRTGIVASDLIAVLKQSVKALELMDTYTFTFVLDPEFNLLVSSEIQEG